MPPCLLIKNNKNDLILLSRIAITLLEQKQQIIYISQRILSLKLSSNALTSVKLSVAPSVADRNATVCAVLKCNNGFNFVQGLCLLCCPCCILGRVWKQQSCRTLRCYTVLCFVWRN